MRDEDGRWAALAAGTVAAVFPALVILGLLRLPVPGFAARPDPVDDTAIGIVFLRRVVALPNRLQPAPGRRPPAGDAQGGTATHAVARAVAIDMRHGTTVRAVAPVAAPLDLSVRDPDATGAVARGPRAWLERDRVLDPRATRFDRAWAPEGNALEQARFRSAAVNAALGLFGGPPRRCTEVERRLRVRDCLALDADEADIEALRRSLD